MFNTLCQMIQSKDKNTGKYKRYGIFIDISHIKQTGNPALSFIALNDGDSFIDIPLDIPSNQINLSPFTRREKEIISLIIQGLTCKAIADKLFISFDTVKNHKKNIFAKAECNSSVQLFRKCITEGWKDLYE